MKRENVNKKSVKNDNIYNCSKANKIFMFKFESTWSVVLDKNYKMQ